MARIGRRVILWTVVVLLAAVAGTVLVRVPRRAVARAVRVAVGPPPPTRPRPPAGRSDVGAKADSTQQDGHAEVPGADTGRLDAGVRGAPRDTSFVLLLGTDRASSRATGRTDAMMVLAFDHARGKIGAFNIPRDLWVDIPGRGPGRINKVVRVGDRDGGPGAGVERLREVIHAEMGIAIDHVASVDFAGFVELVDALGGIEVEVQCPIVDCFWVDGPDRPCQMLSLDTGRHRLDGSTALEFVRSRHGRGEKDRRRRQQVVLLGFKRTLEKAGATALPQLWKIAQAHLETDLDWRAAAYYTTFALEAGPTDLHGFVITRPLVRARVTLEGKHVLDLDRTAFDRAIDGMFEARLPGLVPRKRCPDPDIALKVPAR